MKTTCLSLSAALCLVLASGAAVAKPADSLRAQLVDKDGNTIGLVMASPSPVGTMFNIQVQDDSLEPGPHGLHLHETGDCSASENGFQSAGGHIQSEDQVHGLYNDDPHYGDMSNLVISPTGGADAEKFNARVMLNEGDGEQVLMDDDGFAVMIHQNEDDHVSEDGGGTGARIACAAFN